MDARTEEIRARVEKATPGPWVQLGGQFRFGVNGGNPTREAYKWQRIVEYDLDRPADEKGGIVSWDDAQFIVNARDDVPYLLAELSALREEVERLTRIQTKTENFDAWRADQAEKREKVLREALEEAIEEARAHRADNYHVTPAETIDAWTAALSPSPAQEPESA